MKEAMYYEKKDHLRVQCTLCPHYCLIEDNQAGLCKVRLNQLGTLYASSYGKLTAKAIDPIEKKPLYHFYPGSNILSVSSYGCNMTCVFCQNHQLSQNTYDITLTPVEDLVHEVDFAIAFTYNEPLIGFEYLLDVIKSLKKQAPEKKVVLITNGMINEKPLHDLLPYVDAFNLDVKTFRKSALKNMCHGHLQSILDNLKVMAKKHLEVTCLMVPKLVELEDVEALAKYIADIDKTIPLHLSRYFPAYHYHAPKTSLEFATSAYEIAKKYLDYVYLGNFPDRNNDTYCVSCGQILVRRRAFDAHIAFDGPVCPRCHTRHHIEV